MPLKLSVLFVVAVVHEHLIFRWGSRSRHFDFLRVEMFGFGRGGQAMMKPE